MEREKVEDGPLHYEPIKLCVHFTKELFTTYDFEYLAKLCNIVKQDWASEIERQFFDLFFDFEHDALIVREVMDEVIDRVAGYPGFQMQRTISTNRMIHTILWLHNKHGVHLRVLRERALAALTVQRNLRAVFYASTLDFSTRGGVTIDNKFYRYFDQ